MGGFRKALGALLLAACTTMQPNAATGPSARAAPEFNTLSAAFPSAFGLRFEGDSAKIANSHIGAIIAEELQLDPRKGDVERIVLHTDTSQVKNACNTTTKLPWLGLYCEKTIVLTVNAGRSTVVHELAHAQYAAHANLAEISRRFNRIDSLNGRKFPYMNAKEANHYHNRQFDSLPPRFTNEDSLCAAGFMSIHAAVNRREDVAYITEAAKNNPLALLHCNRPQIIEKMQVLREEGLVPVETPEYMALLSFASDTRHKESEIVTQALQFAASHARSRYAGDALLGAAFQLDKRKICSSSVTLYEYGLTLPVKLRGQYTAMLDNLKTCAEARDDTLLADHYEREKNRYLEEGSRNVKAALTTQYQPFIRPSRFSSIFLNR